MTQKRRAFLNRQLAEEYAWMSRCGGTREGYIARYGSKDDPDHYGDGGELIYQADLKKITGILTELTTARPRKAIAMVK